MSAGRLEPLAPDSLVDRWTRAWVRGGFEGVCTVDVHYEDAATGTPLYGIAELEAHAELVRTAFPDLTVARTGPRVGDRRYACIPWRAEGTHRARLGDLPATDRPVTLHGVHFVELVDGRIRRARGFFDLYEPGIQLGVLPGRGTIAEAALLLLRGFGLRR